MHPGRLEYLKRVLGVEKVSSIYGSAESGIWAVKHFDLPLGQFLFDPALMHVEIIDPDSEGFGRIVVTNLWYFFLFIHYFKKSFYRYICISFL